MQYQILDKNNTIIAWIDVDKDKLLVEDSYIILQGDDLDAVNIEGDLKPIIRTVV